MDNACRLKVVVADVVVEVREVGIRTIGVPIDEFGAGGKAGRNCHCILTVRELVTRLDPTIECIGEVGQRIAECRNLPVEHRRKFPVRVNQAVVQPIVAVDDSGRALLGNPSRKEFVQFMQHRIVIRRALG